ncbi:hypothetical protein NLG97_g2868 [Lecanicillium saksenae]|uniref:Uncharacterized protein n=1 Tax=Lecanicillium saksenae TaxID=468837 RepID=A0ACC1R2B1_9HYPO|nr:hypothetical protein NLG97_g2868 [Lecanicillium saksenae]
MLITRLTALTLVPVVHAQFPPKIEGITVIDSKFHKGVSISYKEPGICETTPGVKSFAGHVHLPPGYVKDRDGEQQDYPISTFFWFFEAREDPKNAPLSIWLNGGASSMLGLLQENGPCFVNSDSKTTRINPWSWNNKVNMLYIDNPTQCGFSYDIPTNGTMNVEDGRIEPDDFVDGVPMPNNTFRIGTFGSQKSTNTANSARNAAPTLWHFAQTFFREFPHYKPMDDRISLWVESYGGHWGPAAFDFFQMQNEKIESGELGSEDAQYLHLDTLGIINGIVDEVLQEEAYISFPVNNTYGITVFNQSLHDELMHNFTRPGGCKEQISACQSEIHESRSRRSVPFSAISDKACDIEASCEMPALTSYTQQDESGVYDIAHPMHDPFPPPHLRGYLAQAGILEAIGSPVNFSWDSAAFGAASQKTQDSYYGFTDVLGRLLDKGIKVHMVYGDRDYASPWIGGETVSVAVPYADQASFKNAGYAELRSGGKVAGMTRQSGNFSFTRVFQAGHMVPAYQPEAAYDIFMRATDHRDIATGEIKVTDTFTTTGPASTWHIKNVMPVKPKPKCYILHPESCVEAVWKTVVDGTALVRDWFVMENESDHFYSEEL